MSIGESRIGLKSLAGLCRRLATSLGAGVDVRSVWAREAMSAQGAARRRFSYVSQAVAQGVTISDAMQKTGNYFPEFFRELARVGEESGHLPEVFRQLAEHYEHQLRLRRGLIASLTWPLVELSISLSVVGLAIWLMGAIPTVDRNHPPDLLGFGLRGTSGLMVYLGVLAAIAVGLFLCYQAAMRGALWITPVQRIVMRIPKLGRALETLALARLAWSMHVTLNSGMNLRPAMQMSLRSTHNVLYTQQIPRVLNAIRAGREIHVALGETGAFPIEFIDAVAVGEQSGRLVESMGHLSDAYQEEARLAMNMLTILLGVAVTGLIAGIIIFFIFRIFSFYANTIYDALPR